WLLCRRGRRRRRRGHSAAVLALRVERRLARGRGLRLLLLQALDDAAATGLHIAAELLHVVGAVLVELLGLLLVLGHLLLAGVGDLVEVLLHALAVLAVAGVQARTELLCVGLARTFVLAARRGEEHQRDRNGVHQSLPGKSRESTGPVLDEPA